MKDGPNAKLIYTGTVQPKPGDRDRAGNPLAIYLPGADLVESVNQAIYLHRPLLIAGEPGVGKTRLAQAVAFELGLPFEFWSIRSTSTARDGLYIYDAAARLHDAQFNKLSDAVSQDRVLNPANYIRLGPLGRAFVNDQPTVVLVDEIDRADVDFPNDLLLEADERRFMIEENGQMVIAKHPPILIITTNESKLLPESFVRRCIYHHMRFPTHEHLFKIIAWHLPDVSPEIIEQAVRQLMSAREQRMEEGKLRLGVNEMIDWVRYVAQYPLAEAQEHLLDLPRKLGFPMEGDVEIRPGVPDSLLPYGGPNGYQLFYTPEKVTINRPLSVFLCHSSGDKGAVRTLYRKLHVEGIDPWLDEEKLLPGQDWEREIKKAVQKSDVVIVCLSRSSINKSGFVQKEIRYALNIAEEKPEGMLYIIPLKLEECELPDQLSRWHWVKVFEPGGIEKLMLALKSRAQSLNTLES